METSVKQRLVLYLKETNKTKISFTRALGLSSGYIETIRNRPSDKVVDSIAKKFPDLNLDWLLKGKGEMLNKTYAGKDAIFAKSVSHIAEPQDYRLVPLYNLDVRGGYGSNAELGTECVLDTIPFKGAYGDDICVPVSGDSMSPTYKPGSIVLLHRVIDWQDFVELGQVYVIELTDGRRLIKELRKSEINPEYNYLCISHNPTFDPVELPKKIIARMYLVKAVYAKTSM